MEALLFSQFADEDMMLTSVLQQAGFIVRATRDLKRAIRDWPEHPADFILVTLPAQTDEPVKLVENLRANSVVPIVLITDSLPEEVHIRMLELGADLVIRRPYSSRLLLYQIRALLRRSNSMPFFSLPTLSQFGVVMDPSTHTVTVEGIQPRHLTQLEFRLLYTLMTHAGRVIPYENIVEHVWGFPGEGSRELVRGLVQRLRSKVEIDPQNPRFILTEPGVGYYFGNRSEE